MASLKTSDVRDYRNFGKQLKSLWKKSLKDGKKLLVGIDGMKPEVRVTGVQYRNRFGDYKFKTGSRWTNNGSWCDIFAAPWEFVIAD